MKPRIENVGVDQSAGDYMENRKKLQANASDTVPEERGNNSGPTAPDTSERGDIAIKGTPDYMGAEPDAAGK